MKRLKILIACLFLLFPLWAYAGTTHVDGNPSGADPSSADGDSLGTAALEWSDLYLADSAVIYGQNDQSNTLTSSATGWTANLNLAATTYGSDGSITDAELLYVNSLSSNAQDQLDARCLESVFGTAIGTGLTLDSTKLKAHTSLQSIAGLTEADVSIAEMTADNAYNVVTSGGNNYILGSNSDNSALEFKTPANVLSEIGAQATDTDLTAIAALAKTDSNFIVGNGSAWVAESGSTARASLGISVNQAASVDDAGTLTPTTGYETVHIALTALTDPRAMTLSETGAVDNEVIIITSVAENTVTFADSSGVQELHGGTATIEQYETIVFKYEVDRWTELLRGTAALGFSTITTVETEYIPISYMIDGASAPDALATITSDTDKADTRTFAGDADEDVLFTWQVPLDCDVTSGIKFRIICFVTNATGPSAETWQFELQGFSLGDGDALNGTLGTAQTSNSGERTDAQYDRVATAWSSAMTATHITALAVGETVTFKLYRDIDDTDTYEQVIGVAGIELKYKRDHDTTF